MVKIAKKKLLTVDALRERLKAVLGKPKVRECPQCHGSGEINAPLAMSDVLAGTALTQSAYYGFMRGGKSLSLENGLKLLGWLEAMERDALAELDEEHEPTDPEAVDHERLQLRAVRNDVAQKAAVAAIEARNRPIQTGGGRHG